MTSSAIPRLTTERLLLRAWCDADLAPFAELNANPHVMRYMPACLTRKESDAMVDRLRTHFTRHGFSLWAVEERVGGKFIGSVGLMAPRFEAFFTPCVEIGWRLAAPYWGRGFATEAARAAAEFAFERLNLPEIVSFTTVENRASRRVMEKLGMTFETEFEHPALGAEHPLRPHVLYRLRNGEATAGAL